MAKLTRSDVMAHVANALRERARGRRQKAAMQFTRDLIGDQCTDIKFTMGQLLKLWNKVGFPR